ncbi:MAG: response regulator [Lachnospiraceae bacterium]|nr:response regulator [Lachnospiraceae bacterium]
MGNQLVWQDRFNIGVEVIDKEHRKLFGILNKLFTNRTQDERGVWLCQEGIKYFKEHATKHFAEEEVYMASISYGGFDMHRRLHDNFRKKTLPELERELNQENYSEEAINHFLGVCAGWLIGHTLMEDRAITGKGVSKWENLLPEEEQAAMKQTIIRLMDDMFQLNSRLLSECYGGEKFGEGIYYRLIYESSQKERWEIILVFEEKLLVNTIGTMLGIQSEEVSVMVVNAARYTAQQFVNCISERFISLDLYELKEENLLSYEQFQRKVEGEKLQFSLLFDTGEGYFAFCAVAPHLMEEGTGKAVRGEVAIKPENAMTEVQKYLNRNQEIKKQAGQKQKILVVDDSELMRQAMKELLGKDYEVEGADSGLSAIRCLTLDRPDLILLDYEMPVCDGSQVLEMIRGEKEFADIPVIFLTGRVDRESVQKVLALKPAGYLLKTLQPAEIKKGIDDYFKKKGLDEKREAGDQAVPKQKILVVDDSELMRQAMKELLGKDYEVEGADSGLSAIRCITLKRPDLILLDYEMPVCDGSQVLEMIRGEKEFTDIPVIFLTGRVDRESVQKVLALKPAGYLLKTLKPADIKKEIDNYFKKKLG